MARTLRGLGVERRIARQPHNKTGWGSLTDAELKVVSLVADGATNAAVAQQLHLSPHTVKTHICNAFAKLDNHFRAHLMDVMGDSGRPARAEIRRRQLLLRCPCQHESPLEARATSAALSCWRPQFRRETIVPTEIFMILAISLYEKSSTSA